MSKIGAVKPGKIAADVYILAAGVVVVAVTLVVFFAYDFVFLNESEKL
jgi:hypothetical protein